MIAGMTRNGEPVDVTEVGAKRSYWRWRSVVPVRPAPYTIYAYITVGELDDGRWYVEEQTIDQRAMAFADEPGALDCAHDWMLGTDWAAQYTPNDEPLP